MAEQTFTLDMNLSAMWVIGSGKLLTKVQKVNIKAWISKFRKILQNRRPTSREWLKYFQWWCFFSKQMDGCLLKWCVCCVPPPFPLVFCTYFATFSTPLYSNKTSLITLQLCITKLYEIGYTNEIDNNNNGPKIQPEE